jgi:hypothetical protein
VALAPGQKRMPKGKVDVPITDQERAFALLLLAGKLTDREAAEAVGIGAGHAAYVKAKPRVKAYMEEHRASVASLLAQHEADALAQCNIGREQIMVRYWEIAGLSPADTNGNVTGQVRALDSLREMLGLVGPRVGDQPEPESDPPDIYRPPWLDEARRGIHPNRNESHESALSSQEPTPAPEPGRIDRRPAAVPETATMHSGGIRNRVGEPGEPHPWVDGGDFGRFKKQEASRSTSA